MKNEHRAQSPRDGICEAAHVQGIGHIGVELVAQMGARALGGGFVVYPDDPVGSQVNGR